MRTCARTHTQTHTHARTHTCTQLCTDTDTHTHKHTHTSTCTHIGAHTHTQARKTYTHACAHTHACARTHTHQRTHTHAHTQANTHTHTHTHTKTHTYTHTHIYRVNIQTNGQQIQLDYVQCCRHSQSRHVFLTSLQLGHPPMMPWGAVLWPPAADTSSGAVPCGQLTLLPLVSSQGLMPDACVVLSDILCQTVSTAAEAYSVQFSPLTGWVVGGSPGTTQERSSSSLICMWPW